MQLIECYIENFGKLSSYTYRFGRGLNSVLAENGWGKTTLSVFIKAMFYGLGAERKQALEENERKKYAPWQGGRYGGSLTFSHEGQTYRIERSFGLKAQDDVFRLVNADTGLNSDAFGDNPGLALFDIDAAGFERTVFLSERNLTGAINNDSISAKLSNLAGTTGDVGGVSTAIARLEDRRRFYMKRGGNGEIPQLRLKISECEDMIIRLERRRDALDEKEQRLIAISSEIKRLEGEYSRHQAALNAAKAENASRTYRIQYDRMKEELLRDKAEYERLGEFFRNGAPTQQQIDTARDAARDARALRASRRDHESPELTDLGSFFLRPTDFSEIESAKQNLRSAGDARAEERMLRTSLEFAQTTLADELGGRIPASSEIDSAISSTGSRLPSLLAIGAAALAVVLLALSFVITPYLLVGAIPLALASAGLAVYSFIRQKKAASAIGKLGIPSDPARLVLLKNRIEAHERRKAEGEARIAGLNAEASRYEERINEFISKYPHGTENAAEALRKIEESYKRYYTLLELSRENAGTRAATDMRIEHLEAIAREFTEKYSTDAPDPFEDVRARLEAYNYAKRTLAKREDDLADFALLHSIDTGAGAVAASERDTAELAVSASDTEQRIRSLRREEALIESEYNSELADIDRIGTIIAERDAYAERLRESEMRLEVIKRTSEMLSEASEAMTSRYIGGTKARFEKYLSLIGSGGEFAMDTDFVLKKVDRGELRAAESYSKGTRDLHAFCLRLALSDSLYGGSMPFVMLDDPFASLDGERLAKAKALVSGITKEKQVIYFTCSKERNI